MINGLINRYRDESGLPFVETILREFGVDIKTTPSPWPSDNLKTLLGQGRWIIASNHPLGGLDGLALIHLFGKIRPDIVFPVNDLLMNVEALTPLFIPINKHGKNTENVAVIDQTFTSGKVILYFPAGLVSRRHRGGVIRDLEWKKTFITRAKKYHRDILPVYVDGRNSSFFYSLANIRKRLHIRANIEMLYLVDEMVRQKDKTIHMIVGEPVSWTRFDKSKTDTQWAQWMKEIVYSLPEKHTIR
jgi:putative hemolysin